MLHKKILLPEYADERMQAAAAHFASHDQITTMSPLDFSHTLTWYVDRLKTKKKYCELPLPDLETVAGDPLIQSCVLLDQGAVDGVVTGAHYTTADVLRAGLRIIGTAENAHTVSSSMLMTLKDGTRVIFADCAVVAQPSAQQLTEIALASVETARICGITEPRVAFLSFSTHGSAQCPSIDPIREAVADLSKHPCYNGFVYDGEVQFDAAFLPEIAAKKSPESTFCTSPANVFIFPNLHAANIAYKITERLAGATATGPLLQGFAKPLNDLSRGCSTKDVIAMIMHTAMQSTSS